MFLALTLSTKLIVLHVGRCCGYFCLSAPTLSALPLHVSEVSQSTGRSYWVLSTVQLTELSGGRREPLNKALIISFTVVEERDDDRWHKNMHAFRPAAEGTCCACTTGNNSSVINRARASRRVVWRWIKLASTSNTGHVRADVVEMIIPLVGKTMKRLQVENICVVQCRRQWMHVCPNNNRAMI